MSANLIMPVAVLPGSIICYNVLSIVTVYYLQPSNNMYDFKQG